MVYTEQIERLLFLHNKRISAITLDFERFLLYEIDWNLPLIGITGGRGVGKTTMLIQHFKKNFGDSNTAIYISLDEYLFETCKLIEVVEELYKKNYTVFYLDEVHKYANWSKDLKLLHDTYHDIHIVFTGSSILDIYKGESDLSRRAVLYDLPILSFREYLDFENFGKFKAVSLDEVMQNHEQLAEHISSNFDVLAVYKKYLKEGAYPFYKKVKAQYLPQLVNVLNMVLEGDLPSLVQIDYKSVHKIKRLLYILSQSGPFQPNISKLSGQIEVSRNKLLEFFDFLTRAQIINTLKAPSKSESHLTKPDKVFLHNTNLMYALGYGNLNAGSLRETFFINQVSAKYKTNTPKVADFMVDEKYFFEVGGPTKSFSQISGIPNSFLAIDGITVGNGNKIPLWLFGFLY